MGITQTYSRFKASENLFRCPICAAGMKFKNENSLICANSHCFDLAKQGYINFVPNQSKMKYTKSLFESRRKIFQSGFYDPLKEKIKSLLSENFAGQSGVRILDVGCGEGFFISNLGHDEAQEKEVFGLDIVKDAVVLAAKENKTIKWIVGDLANIPLQGNTVDILLNVFTPANYQEFLRILKEGGILFKVMPGKQYLAELRAGAGDQLLRKEYSNEEVLQCFHKNMLGIERMNLCYRLPVTQDQLVHFMKMTPMMFHVETDSIELEDIRQITIDVELVIGQKK